jgi:protease-4
MGPFVRYDEITAMDNIQAVAPANTKEKIGGISVSYLTAGEGKDFGNPFRHMTDKERRRAQAGINNMYTLFVDHVASGRHVSSTVVRNER